MVLSDSGIAKGVWSILETFRWALAARKLFHLVSVKLKSCSQSKSRSISAANIQHIVFLMDLSDSGIFKIFFC